MATTNTPNLTPGEMDEKGGVPSNLDAARPVIDRIKDAQAADVAGAVSGGDQVIDNSPETAAENERAEAEAKDAEKAERADAKKADAAKTDAAKTDATRTSAKRTTETK